MVLCFHPQAIDAVGGATKIIEILQPKMAIEAAT